MEYDAKQFCLKNPAKTYLRDPHTGLICQKTTPFYNFIECYDSFFNIIKGFCDTEENGNIF